ncbi:hypothetical protein PHJA_001493000 [Phtheirospermum japonicum]|uniref:Uncharacterized protein n=1 Tax=Phtheirospermum japonicum TaxID=374723 RepID=A0A830C331_9LAMI|nr:hypothetical protein PHJA_001493000 [Phtheirospermum japonicum]
MDDYQAFWASAINCIMSSQDQVRKYTRTRSKRRMLDVDLNAVPPCESRDQEGPSNHTRSQDRQVTQGGVTMPPSIDVDALEDDVIISSPRAFAEAKNNSRRVREHTVVVDLDSEKERTECDGASSCTTTTTAARAYIQLSGLLQHISRGDIDKVRSHLLQGLYQSCHSCTDQMPHLPQKNYCQRHLPNLSSSHQNPLSASSLVIGFILSQALSFVRKSVGSKDGKIDYCDN